MQKLKFAALVVAVMFIAGASFTAQAQLRRMAPVKSMPLPVGGLLSGSYSSYVTATELSMGEADYAVSQMFGWTSYGQTKGDLSGHVFLSINYVLPSYSYINPGTKSFIPPSASEITGGSWSQLIFVDGQYAGSVSGRVVGGTLTWNELGQTATVSLKLTSDGGTDAYVGVSGSGEFTGTLDRTNLVPSINGTLTLNY